MCHGGGGCGGSSRGGGGGCHGGRRHGCGHRRHFVPGRCRHCGCRRRGHDSGGHRRVSVLIST